jgi:hypothetical protein
MRQYQCNYAIFMKLLLSMKKQNTKNNKKKEEMNIFEKKKQNRLIEKSVSTCWRIDDDHGTELM